METLKPSVEQALNYNNSYQYLPIKDRCILKNMVIKKLNKCIDANGVDYFTEAWEYGKPMLAKANFNECNPYTIWNGVYRQMTKLVKKKNKVSIDSLIEQL
jgi:hypothetical protein